MASSRCISTSIKTRLLHSVVYSIFFVLVTGLSQREHSFGIKFKDKIIVTVIFTKITPQLYDNNMIGQQELPLVQLLIKSVVINTRKIDEQTQHRHKRGEIQKTFSQYITPTVIERNEVSIDIHNCQLTHMARILISRIFLYTSFHQVLI